MKTFSSIVLKKARQILALHGNSILCQSRRKNVTEVASICRVSILKNFVLFSLVFFLVTRTFSKLRQIKEFGKDWLKLQFDREWIQDAFLAILITNTVTLTLANRKQSKHESELRRSVLKFPLRFAFHLLCAELLPHYFQNEINLNSVNLNSK